MVAEQDTGERSLEFVHKVRIRGTAALVNLESLQRTGSAHLKSFVENLPPTLRGGYNAVRFD